MLAPGGRAIIGLGSGCDPVQASIPEALAVGGLYIPRGLVASGADGGRFGTRSLSLNVSNYRDLPMERFLCAPKRGSGAGLVPHLHYLSTRRGRRAAGPPGMNFANSLLGHASGLLAEKAEDDQTRLGAPGRQASQPGPFRLARNGEVSATGDFDE